MKNAIAEKTRKLLSIKELQMGPPAFVSPWHSTGYTSPFQGKQKPCQGALGMEGALLLQFCDLF